ncbi:hypothetical protein DVH24_028811 [Malus domestica]|uniref:Uncharacterized protein n=1 Tax=Malus domestica TaxID=3750 RepID=A0A498J1H6_MALDO|nr:hypothetical protein DVH24_028811 [Malus domestica]
MPTMALTLVAFTLNGDTPFGRPIKVALSRSPPPQRREPGSDTNVRTQVIIIGNLSSVDHKVVTYNKVSRITVGSFIRPSSTCHFEHEKALVKDMSNVRDDFHVSAEGGVEVLDDPDCPVGVIGQEPEDFGSALVLVADAEGALLLLVGVGVDGGLGFEVGRSPGSGG